MSTPDDTVLMTLAGIAYGDPKRIAEYLSAAVPTADWKVIWMPEVDAAPPNFMFLATDDAGNYVVAIRGTYPNPFSEAYWDDGSQSSPFGDMADWPGAPGAKIGGGTQTGLNNLLAMKDIGGRTIMDTIAALPAQSHITVTGHSLGGTLTPVLALSLIEADPSREIYATSFAGMTPGNSSFAALFGDGTALSGRVRRVYNTLDTVGYGWDQVYATHDFYQPAPEGGAIVSALLLATEARLKLGGYDYTAVGSPVPLTGKVKPPTISCELVAYVIENLHQHVPDTYLELLGAPPLPFSIIWGTMTVSRNHALATQPASPNGPVVHVPDS
jgi:hypothetical protein